MSKEISKQEVDAKFWEAVGKVYEAVASYDEAVQYAPDEYNICSDQIYETVDKLLEPDGDAFECDVILPKLLARWGAMSVSEKCQFMSKLKAGEKHQETRGL